MHYIMARRMTSKKLEPAVSSIYYKTPVFAGTRAVTLDLNRDLSLLNRRFYRQGTALAVESIEIFTSTGTGSAIVSRIPMSWVALNAWKKGFATWMKMNREALAETPSVRPKFLDFKVYMDSTHAGVVDPVNPIPTLNLLPQSMNGAITVQALPGEWEYSKISIPLVSPAGTFNPGETVERELLAVGPSYPGPGTSGLDSLSLIEGYAASRGLPNVVDPNTPTDAGDTGGGTPENWMQAVFNEGTNQSHEVIEDMLTENNKAPYPFEDGVTTLDTMYPGGANQLTGLEIVDLRYITASTIGGTTRLKGGVFPCGLLRLNLQQSDNDFIAIKVNLVPGHMRGYLAEKMTEM